MRRSIETLWGNELYDGDELVCSVCDGKEVKFRPSTSKDYSFPSDVDSSGRGVEILAVRLFPKRRLDERNTVRQASKRRRLGEKEIPTP
jgi:hypothetical protein